MFEFKATPTEYKAGLDRAIANGWLVLHESGTFVLTCLLDGQPILPVAHINPPATSITLVMKRAVSSRVSVQSLRIARLNCWTIPQQHVFQ